LWAFKSRPDMRTTRIEGVQAIDPMQSNLPEAWKKYSSYRITDGSKITMHEIQRGCPEQDTDSLFLSRELWLDFKGHGATIRDLLSGTLGKRRYLSMDDRSYTLGRMSLDGKDRLITRLGDLAQGLELDRGPVSLEAVSRLTHLESGKSVNLGWDCDYQSADVTVNLPPGWRLLGVRGGNVNSGDTWLNQWSMLDFFLILIVCYAAIRLWNIPWGVLFFTGLILTCHEKATPFYLFVFLILLVALIRFKTGPHTPPSPGVTRFKKLVLSALVIYSAFFSVVQIRSALYPQLESPGGFTLGYGSSSPEPAMMMAPPEPFPESESRIMAVMDEEAPMEKMMPIPRAPVPHKKKYTLSSENIITQTGPAIPTWDFKRITIDLGRVPSSHSLGLYLMSPAHNSFFSIIRVLLVMVMILRFIPVRFRDRLRHKNKHATPVCLALVSAITGICLMSPARAHADIPSPQLLSELETRLTKAADCYPQCASLSEVSISLPDANGKNDKQFIVIDFTVNAALKTAMPLPSGLGSWELYDMRLDEAPHLAVMRDNRSQWTLIPQGVHQISLRGMAVGQSSFRFSFPLKPALVRVHGKDWDIIGLDQNMQTENSLIATRKASVPEQSTIPADDATLESPEKPLADHVTVRRDVSCDREWTLTTTVERFPGTDDQKSVMIALPLLKDEKVRTDLPGLNLNETTAQVSLAPGVHRLSWISSLPITPTLDLSVPLSASWSEIWSLKLSSRWHLTSNGPPMVCPDSGEHSFWYPWPGEHLNLSFTQMEPAAGDYFTIDSASIDYYIEKGSNRIVLTFSLRTSQGRNYTIPTPKDCMVKTILINGRSMPFSGSPDTIDIPLSPGPQTIRIEWNQANTWNTSFLERFIKPDIIAFPPIDMGVDAANVDMTMHLPDRSWIIYTHGPYLGPALLTWGLCGLILMGALILGRMPISPLSSRTWTILGLGLLSLSLPQILCVVGWFLVMELRKNTSPVSPLLFNLMQVFLMAWTAWMVFTFYQVVSQGLISVPDMTVTGNHSTQDLLIWTQDRSPGILPSPWVAIYSAHTYHLLMLFWSLWLSVQLLPWSRFAVAALKSDTWFRPFLFAHGRRKIKK
ncbi:MAG: hypothetical protein KKD44_03410, partial [Proteobacteria bacterium]|nr:hypothetical protein [Pseudomonadota bacterium]